MILKRLRIRAAHLLYAAAIPALLTAHEPQQQPLTVADHPQQPLPVAAEVLTPHAECLFFTKEGERFRPGITNPRDPRYRAEFGLSRMTEAVAQRLGAEVAPSTSSDATSAP